MNCFPVTVSRLAVYTLPRGNQQGEGTAGGRPDLHDTAIIIQSVAMFGQSHAFFCACGVIAEAVKLCVIK